MRFLKTLPVVALALAFSLGACAQQGEEGGEDLTPADTAQMEAEEQVEEGMEQIEEGAEQVEEGAERMEEEATNPANPCASDGMDHDGETANPCGGQ